MARATVSVHNHGYVALIDVMGDDEAVVDAARISYDRRGRSADRALIRYLLRHRHTSPFEMAVMKFEVKMPIFVARQWVRHRTASINEVSARYTQLPEEMFIPTEFAVQSTDNKQGRSDVLPHDIQRILHELMGDANESSYSMYTRLLEAGVAREMAREVLNLNIYTKFIWKMDLHNLMHFLSLRLDKHAQREIREYAEAVESHVSEQFPMCHEAFVDYVRNAYTCSWMEMSILQELLHFYQRELPKLNPVQANKRLRGIDERAADIMSKRELDEFKQRFLS